MTKSTFRLSNIIRQVQAYLQGQGGEPVYETVTDTAATRRGHAGDRIPNIEELTARGVFSYTQYTDKQAMKDAWRARFGTKGYASAPSGTGPIGSEAERYPRETSLKSGTTNRGEIKKTTCGHVLLGREGENRYFCQKRNIPPAGHQPRAQQ